MNISQNSVGISTRPAHTSGGIWLGVPIMSPGLKPLRDVVVRVIASPKSPICIQNV